MERFRAISTDIRKKVDNNNNNYTCLQCNHWHLKLCRQIEIIFDSQWRSNSLHTHTLAITGLEIPANAKVQIHLAREMQLKFATFIHWSHVFDGENYIT